MPASAGRDDPGDGRCHGDDNPRHRNVTRRCQRANMHEMSADAREQAPILVVDDDPKILQLVRMYLEREGFAVATASDGLAALAAVREQPPRLMVLDLMLPALDGFAVLRAARAHADLTALSLAPRGPAAQRV